MPGRYHFAHLHQALLEASGERCPQKSLGQGDLQRLDLALGLQGQAAVQRQGRLGLGHASGSGLDRQHGALNRILGLGQAQPGKLLGILGAVEIGLGGDGGGGQCCAAAELLGSQRQGGAGGLAFEGEGGGVLLSLSEGEPSQVQVLLGDGNGQLGRGVTRLQLAPLGLEVVGVEADDLLAGLDGCTFLNQPGVESASQLGAEGGRAVGLEPGWQLEPFPVLPRRHRQRGDTLELLRGRQHGRRFTGKQHADQDHDQ